jgi:hypothetical protein
MKGVRRGRISGAGVVKSAKPSNGEDSLGERGELTLRLGGATPNIGDVSDEDADEDGALIVAGYASLTPLRGPHEDADPGLDGLVHAALEAIARHLHKVR